MKIIIITHQSPDMDALLSTWLVSRFILSSADVVFVNTGAVTADDLADADAVVDTGKEFDPSRLRFDHHQFPGAAANETCAALQVYRHILQFHPERVEHLHPLVYLVFAGDTGRDEYGAAVSREVGLHALLAARRRAGWSDDQLWAWACTEFDLLSERLRRSYEARQSLAEKVSWQSADGKIVVIIGGDHSHTYAAFETGVVLVAWQNEVPLEDSVSYAIGVNRAPGVDSPHLGALVDRVPGIRAILDADSWYYHQSGFFMGRGTLKATRQDPSPVDITEVAKALDAAWSRA